jgi:serine/threonine protein kinase
MSGKSPRQTLGKKIAEGSYGCIYRNDKKVLKVSDTKEAEVELRIANIIKNIPNWSEYYIIQDKEEFETKNFTRVRPMYQGDCKIIRDTTNSNLRLLSSSYGGVSVRNIEITESFSYEKSIRHLLEAVTKLNDQGICHYDLHGGNILEDINGKQRIIDFGSAFIGDMADVSTVKKHKYPFSPMFSAQPPELAIQNAIVENRDIQSSLEELIVKREIFRNSSEYTGITPSYVRKELYDFVTTEYHATDLAWAEYYRNYWRKWDTWSIGVLFLDFLKRALLLPALRKELWDNPSMHNKIRMLLRGCLEPNPKKRFSANDALKFWVSSS